MILGFAHPALVVSDLQRARRFYESMFGFRHLADEGWAQDPAIDRAVGLRGSACRGCLLKGRNSYLELFEYSAPASVGPSPAALGAHEPGIRHLAFYVDDCFKELERLKRLGGEAMGEPCGSSEQGRAVYCRDPFGNIIELAEPRPGEELPGFSAFGDLAGTELENA